MIWIVIGKVGILQSLLTGLFCMSRCLERLKTRNERLNGALVRRKGESEQLSMSLSRQEADSSALHMALTYWCDTVHSYFHNACSKKTQFAFYSLQSCDPKP